MRCPRRAEAAAGSCRPWRARACKTRARRIKVSGHRGTTDCRGPHTSAAEPASARADRGSSAPLDSGATEPEPPYRRAGGPPSRNSTRREIGSGRLETGIESRPAQAGTPRQSPGDPGDGSRAESPGRTRPRWRAAGPAAPHPGRRGGSRGVAGRPRRCGGAEADPQVAGPGEAGHGADAPTSGRRGGRLGKPDAGTRCGAGRVVPGTAGRGRGAACQPLGAGPAGHGAVGAATGGG